MMSPRLALFVFLCILFISLSITPLCAKEYSLDELYKIAIERSERVRIYVEDVCIAMRNKDKAFYSFLPSLSAFGGYTRYSDKKRDRSSSILIQPDDVGYGGLRLDQSLSLGGREFTAYTMSKEGIIKSTYDLTDLKKDYIFLVSFSYYDILRAKKAVEISRANVERLTKHRDAAASRLKVGEVTKTDLLRAEAELSGAKSDLIRAENNLKLTKANLARIVGLNEDYDAEVEKGDRYTFEKRCKSASLSITYQYDEEIVWHCMVNFIRGM